MAAMLLLRNCVDHGYYRGVKCPECGNEGNFLMNDEEMDSLGRTLAGVLRHFPEKFNIEMDKNGWVNIRALCRGISRRNRNFHWLKPHHIIGLATTDEKGRYQVDDDHVRATYGHSLELDMDDLPDEDIPEFLFYPATPEESALLLETGLRPTDRRKVHLSMAYENAEEAGRHRVENPVILRIKAGAAIEAGYKIRHAASTVFTADEIPSEFLEETHPE